MRPYQAELDTLRAVSTVPPRTTSFMPSTTDEPPTPPTMGWMRDLRASIAVDDREESQLASRAGCGGQERWSGSQCGESGNEDG